MYIDSAELLQTREYKGKQYVTVRVHLAEPEENQPEFLDIDVTVAFTADGQPVLRATMA